MKYVATLLVLLSADYLMAQPPRTPPGHLKRNASRGATTSRSQRPTPQVNRAAQVRSSRGLGRGRGQQNRMLHTRKRMRQDSRRRVDQNVQRPQPQRPLPTRLDRRLTGPERALQQRLAAIDRMRDRAVETDNVDMLNRADRLEKMAREQYQHMIREERSVKGGRPEYQPLVPPLPPQQNTENQLPPRQSNLSPPLPPQQNNENVIR